MKQNLQKLLWQRWGDKAHPAEWDGNVYGGGKVSQRMWEYFWAIDQMDNGFDWRKCVDVGSGPTQFFPNLLRADERVVTSIDPAISTQNDDHGMNLSDWVMNNQNKALLYDCVFAISVLEHVPENERARFMADLDKFANSAIVITMELGPKNGVWPPVRVDEFKFFSEMKAHYPVKMEACPMWCENSNPTLWRPFGIVFHPLAWSR
jgi:hypothetical protein